MALLRGQVILGAALGAMAPRRALALSGVQLCKAPWWSSKPFYLRNPPFTIASPHYGQVETRVHFGEAGRAAKGSKGFIEGIPAVASKVRAAMKGYKCTKPLVGKAPTGFHTLEQLKAML